MVLHLLGQKSWNVYGSENQERVRRDEAAARLKEEEEERRMQEADAEHRLLELRRRRGLITSQQQEQPQERQHDNQGQVGRRDGLQMIEYGVARAKSTIHRKMIDEEIRNDEYDDRDTQLNKDRDTRAYDARVPVTVAISDLDSASTRLLAVDSLVHKSLIGSDGHINLFQDLEGNIDKKSKLSSRDRNPEYEKEKAEKEAKLEMQFTSRLDKPADELKPWYVSLQKVGEKQEKKTEKQLNWERKRDQRAKDRNDPLMVMKNGLRELNEVEEERRRIKEERKRELDKLKMEDRELASFTLDGNRLTTDRGSGTKSNRHRSRNGQKEADRDRDRGRHRSRSRRRGRSYSRSRDRDRSRSHRQIGDDDDDRERKHRKHRRRRSRSLTGNGLSSSSRVKKMKNDNSMEKLRAEREKRELLERQRAEAFLVKIHEDEAPGYKVSSGGRYSAQFATR